MVRLLASAVLGLLLMIAGVTAAEAARLSPGDVLVASDKQVHHFSWFSEYSRVTGFRGVVVVPMLRDGEPIGVINVAP